MAAIGSAGTRMRSGGITIITGTIITGIIEHRAPSRPPPLATLAGRERLDAAGAAGNIAGMSSAARIGAMMTTTTPLRGVLGGCAR
jgi:hypothetical protein